MPIFLEDNNNNSKVKFLGTQPIINTSKTQMSPTQNEQHNSTFLQP